jgi:hypothetical protein
MKRDEERAQDVYDRGSVDWYLLSIESNDENEKKKADRGRKGKRGVVYCSYAR